METGKYPNRIGEHREINGMTQAQFARKLGILPQEFGDIEKGIRECNEYTERRILSALEIHPDNRHLIFLYETKILRRRKKKPTGIWVPE